MFLRILLFSPLLISAEIQFDNALKDRPSIQCGHGKITLDVETLKDAPAHVFAKGHYKKEGCSFSNITHAVFDFTQCDVRRKREVNPKGMLYTMTVVVQLHPLFVTRVDRSFHVSCFYQETEKAVGTGMNVSDPDTVTINGTDKQPECKYTLHKGSAHGPLAKLAAVGEPIYHVWECPSDHHAMLIHDCSIVDGQGTQQLVIDERGCSTDDYLIQDLSYTDDLTRTIAASNAFSFPDQTMAYFNCKIKLCLKDTDECRKMTPPRCGMLSGSHDDPMKNELDKDQLITTTPSFRTFDDTTTAKPTETSTVEATVITTTITEVTSTSSKVPESTTIIVPVDRFPIPGAMDPSQEIERKENETEVEGSGLEITSSTPISVFIKNEAGEGIYIRPGDSRLLTTSEEVSSDGATTAKREIRRRDTVLDVDISSPELTILDKDLAAGGPEALRSSQESTGSDKKGKSSNVCIPIVGVWIVVGLLIFCTTSIVTAICYAQKQRRKFRMLP